MNSLHDIDRIDLFLEKLGRYWKCNRGLRFGQVVATLESECKSDIFNAEENRLDAILDKLILESCYPELRYEIAQVYSDELNSLEEADRSDLVNAILGWHIAGEGFIASTAMRLRVEGYLSSKTKV